MILNVLKKIGLVLVSLIIAQGLMYYVFDDILLNITSSSIVFILSRLILAIILLSIFLSLYSFKQQKSFFIPNKLLFLIYSLYTLFLISITLLKGEVINSSYNLIPFNSLLSFTKVNNSVAFINIISNLVMFVPLGVILYFLKKKISTSFQIILYTSLGIELLQFFFKKGIFDIDDLILNSLGGLIGIFISKYFLSRNSEINIKM